MNGRPRLAWCTLLCLLPLVPLSARLAYLQILEHRRMSSLARGEFSRETLEIIPRGRILDREGRVLAQSLPSWSAFLDPSVFRRDRSATARLARALRLDEAEVRRKAAGRSRFVWLKRRLNPAETETLKSLRIDGIGLMQDETRYYPNGDLARPLLGAVGADDKGLSGLESRYERLLGGAARKVRLLRDGSGNSMELAPRGGVAPVPDLILTIDRNIQHLAETALLAGAERHRPERASIAVQDPRTGDILALADYPGDPLRIPSIQCAYEPGSTYKLVAMASALDEGLARPDEIIDAEGGRWQFTPRLVIRDDEPHRLLTVREVLEQSSNIGMAKLGLRLGPERLYRWSRTFGFGSKTSLAFPGESPGILKPPGGNASLARVLLANNSFGQGVAVTPIQLLGAYSAVANGGTLLEPRLVLAEGGAPAPEPSVVRRVASAATLEALRGMLEGVVERGTGVAARIPGYRVAGKTGTAQKIDAATGKYSTANHVASFIGFAPVSDPRWTILVVMDSPKNQYHGAETAAPVFAELLRQLLALKGIPPDRPVPLRVARGGGVPPAPPESVNVARAASTVPGVK